MGVRAAAVALGLMLGVSGDPALADAPVKLLSFDDLNGWRDDDHAAALSVFQGTCPDMNGPEWQALCALSETAPNARTFFELFFRPVLIGDPAQMLFTGYFEPELNGSRRPSSRYRYPLYRVPPEARDGQFLSRREIEETGALEGRALEIVWVDDPVELFFLQVQGSGRVVLPGGGVVRVGYGGRNGHPYRSIGQELVRQGVFEAHQVSAQVIRNYVRGNPEAGRELLMHNPSYIFFREVEIDDPATGPLGAMNRPITPLRSIAVDPRYTPLGAPVWIEKAGAVPMHRLMVAQDTGGVILGPQRADIFYGFGDAAGDAAGRIRDAGRMVVLMPIELAHQAAPDA